MGKVLDMAEARNRRAPPPADPSRGIRSAAERAGRGDKAREKPQLQVTNEFNTYEAVQDLLGRARLEPGRKMARGSAQEAERAMARFREIDSAIAREVEKFRNGTYSSSERPEEYVLAADRVRIAMYFVDEIREMYERVKAENRESLLQIFIRAADGAYRCLSGNFFSKNSLQVLDPYGWGLFDLRARAPRLACAFETGMKDLGQYRNPGDLDEVDSFDRAAKSYAQKLQEKIRG